MKVWVKLCVKDKPPIYLLMAYEGYHFCVDGSVSNWLDTDFGMRGWTIKGIGIMNDCIQIDIE